MRIGNGVSEVKETHLRIYFPTLYCRKTYIYTDFECIYGAAVA